MKKVVHLSLLLLLLAVLGSAGTVLYAVFFGGESVVVPPLVGTSVLDAVEMSEHMGLQVRVDQEESLEPRGTVIAQWPQSGVKVRTEKILVLKVSKGGYKKTLPDLRGMEFSRASGKLQELDFVLGDVIRVESDKPAGVVIAQNPAAPVMISRTRPVALLVSMGPERGKGGAVPVPDVLGKDERSARKLVAESGLSASVEYVYTQSSPPGMAVALKPKAGTSLAPGKTVTIKVSTMKQPVRSTPSVPATEVSTTDASVSEPQIILPGSSASPPQSPTGAKVLVLSPGDASGPRPGGSVSVGAETSSPQVPQPQAIVPVSVDTKPQAATAKKMAKIRYQVPPLTKPLPLKIEIIDSQGSRVLVNREVSGGEFILEKSSYIGEAAVTIYLGDEFVWQDRYR
ncbi:MAG: penicillin-binding protein [Dethiosulfovibrio peptidovorans]|nr:MAG: penicillin-binding protein [Dethiosulfovibrio peptidovorans]